MPYLRRKTDLAVTEYLAYDSPEYQVLKTLRAQTALATVIPTGQSGFIPGEVGANLQPGAPLWEDMGDELLEDPQGGRVIVLRIGGAATAASETSSEEYNPEVAGTLTDVEYVADPTSSGITGQATNNRVVTLQQVTFTGTATVARAVTSLAAVTFGAGTNAVAQGTYGGPVPVPMTISNAAFAAGAPLQVVSSVNGTGLPDPGGLVYAVYTRT